jgi:hypothetical protein
MAIIEESGMRFGDYPDDTLFHIERCPQYQKRLMPNGVKSCEFILKRGNTLLLVEAKTSCPNQITAESPQEKIEKYKAYCSDITEKMRHSLSLYASILLKRQVHVQVPEALKSPDLSDMNIKLVLVVKEAEEKWLFPLRDKLACDLKRELRIWNCAGFYVINETKAREKRLVL